MAVFVVHALRVYTSNAIIDDAFIFYRYATNWANGHGIVWNPGEPPIEGYTSFTFLACLTAGIVMGADPLVTGQLIGLASSMVILVVVQLMVKTLYPRLRSSWSCIPPLLLALSPSFVLWARYGMETNLFSLLLIVAIWCHLRELDKGEDTIMSSLWFALAAITRLDALLFWAIAQVQAISRAVARRSAKHHGQRDASRCNGTGASVLARLPALATFALVFGLYFAWRLIYFDALFPNTFYAKAGGGRYAVEAGIRYIMALLREPMAIGLWLLPVGLVRGKASNLASFAGPVTALYLSYVVWLGGDCLPQFRFYIYLAPLLAVVAIEILTGMTSDLSRLLGMNPQVLLGIVLIPVCCMLVIPSAQEISSHPSRLLRPLTLIDQDDGSNAVQYRRKLIGLYFAEIGRPSDWIAAVPAGAIPYFSGLLTIDMLGLNDHYLARQPVDPAFVASSPRKWFPGHMKGDGHYVLARQPTYILLSDRFEDEPNHIPEWFLQSYRPTQQIWENGYFQRCYTAVSVPVNAKYFTYYRLRADCRTMTHSPLASRSRGIHATTATSRE